MKKYFLLILVFISLSNLFAQASFNKIASLSNERAVEIDTVRILALQVDFQTDKDDATFGNGKFGSIYTKDYGNTIIDPLPHDKNYFEAHLSFVRNYFNKVSNNNLVVEYTVLPNIITLSKTMRNYSPPTNSTDFKQLGELSQEAWRIADSSNPEFDFAAFNTFVIFHAGVGRDVSLPGSLGNERDLPSLYLSLSSLQKIFGNTFEGFHTNNGLITNSIIIPETENRELETIGSSILFELSINGLLVSSIASRLGLPDLFDTKTGLSAIGRFGLMDGQSIFTYNGLFPPEPSPWEKIFLGWAQPIEISKSAINQNITLNAGEILKVPINNQEYYLVENRQRDINKDGAKVQSLVNGEVKTFIFSKDTSGFYSYQADSVDGVVIDIDEYDWAVPGNGIVIWHIDEEVIDNNFSSNSINNNKSRRGVDVEEADGVQDIGERFTTILGDEVIGEGFEEDLWYSKNPSDLYKNLFSPTSFPNTKSNDGSNSLITFSNFSDSANTMTFTLSFSDSLIRSIAQIELPTSKNITHVSQSTLRSGKYITAVTTDDTTYILNDNYSILAELNSFSQTKVIIEEISFNRFVIAGTFNGDLNYAIFDSALVSRNTLSNEKLTSQLILDNLFLWARTNNNSYARFGIDYESGNIAPAAGIQTGPIVTNSILSSNHDYQSFIGKTLDSKQVFSSTNRNEPYYFTNEIPVMFTMVNQYVDVVGNLYDVILTDKNNFYIFGADDNPTIISKQNQSNINSFSIGDVNQIGQNSIVYVEGNKLHAIDFNGVEANNFPIIMENELTGTPLLLKFSGNKELDVIVHDVKGNIYAIKKGGALVQGFPLTAGSRLSNIPVINNVLENGTILTAVTDDNTLYTWQISDMNSTLLYTEEYGTSNNENFVFSTRKSMQSAEFFNSDKVYNYPNPVYQDETAIRYYTSEDSKVNIKIFDLAGKLITELNKDAMAGFDGEVMWNVKDVESGIYMARVELNSNTSGKTGYTIIKIAVVK